MNGPFGNMFPYTNFHEMNLDWMIQVAKDFLDQYTNIQETIQTGLDNIASADEQAQTDLQNKYDALKDLLDGWYDQHSEDIAGQLADALEDLSEALSTAIGNFNENADTKEALVLASIPDDYTALGNAVTALNTSYAITKEHTERGFNTDQSPFELNYKYAYPLQFVVGGIVAATGAFNTTTTTRVRLTEYVHVDAACKLKVFNLSNAAFGVSIIKKGTPISYVGDQYQTAETLTFDAEAGADYCLMARVEAHPSDNVTDAYLKMANDCIFLTKGDFFQAEQSVAYFGKTFIFCTNSKLRIQTSQTCRYLHGRTSVTGTDSEFEYTIGAGLYYICVDTSGAFGSDTFKIRNYATLTKKDFLIAWVYNYWVYSPYDTVVCNTVPMLPLYVRQDIPLYINQDRLGFEIVPSYLVKTDGSYCKFKNTYKMINANGGSIYFDTALIGSYPKNRSITLNDHILGAAKILMVGDSITNRGWLQQQLLERNSDLVFLGSYQTGINTGVTDYLCEAYPGANASDMILENGAHSHINGDYETYITSYLNGQVPDIVTIEFGLNESDASEYRTAVQTLIDLIKTYDTENSHTTKIYVLMPFERAMTENMGDNYNFPRTNRYVASKTLDLEAYSLTDCVLIPTNMILDDRYDYTWTDFDYGYGKTIQVLDDYVHPSQSVGFKKIADTIYSYLGV